MALELKSIHKAAVIGWSEAVRGHDASLQVELHDGTTQEKRTVPNDGEANLFFPLAYTGSVKVTVQGSRGGEETGTVSV